MQSFFLRQTRISKSWLFNPPLQGAWAAAVSVTAVAVAMLVRMNLSAAPNDQLCGVFCPFVLITAIICGWRWALAVAVGSVIACNTIMMGAPYIFHLQRSQIEGLVTFLGYSALIILVVQLFRMTAARSLRQAGAKERASGIVFSDADGQAWASWYGIDAPVRLGSRDEVVPMMKDFIAQVELGNRLQAGLDTRARCADLKPA